MGLNHEHAGRPQRLEEYFLDAAARFPERPAIRAGALELSYAQARARVVGLARRLVAAGVGPEVVVGLVLDRGAPAVLATLAVHLAGGAYLPVNPSLPPERLSFILSDSRPKLLISAPEQLSAAERTGLPVLRFDPTEPVPERSVEEAGLTGDRRPEHLGWIIYTSGSSGTPKAVLVSHAGIGLVADYQRHRLGLREHERVLQLASPSFDACIFEMLLAFTCAGTLYVPQLVGEADRDLAGFLRQHRITVAAVPPGVLASIEDPDTLPELRTVVVGGDACSVSVAARWGNRGLWNVYGLTETTVISTAHRVSAADVAAGVVPVGGALPGAHCYLLDEQLAPVPAGTPGELYIGGPGVSRGFLGAPAGTAERYLPDPFGSVPGGRMYRTGDRCVADPAGELQFLGRVDRQAKIRGYRVELDEIEMVLRRDEQVADAVVAAEPDPAGAGLRLVGYFTARQDTVDLAALRRTMAAALPAHMIPSVFHQLSRLPITANGKIDRDAAARLVVAADAETGRGADGPATPSVARPVGAPETGDLLIAHWSELLGTQPGPRDNFFDLGGHSLTANRLLHVLRTRFGERVPSGIVYDHPVLADLAAALDRLGGPDLEPRGAVASQPDGPPLVARAGRRPARPSR